MQTSKGGRVAPARGGDPPSESGRDGSGTADELAARVLLVAPEPLFDDRGTPIAVRQVVEALSQMGYRVEVLTYPIGRRLPIPGVEVHRASNPLGIRRVPVGFSWRKVALDVSLVAALARLLRARGGAYACVHAVEEAAFPAMLLCRRRGIPVLYDMQSSVPEQLSTRRFFRARAIQALLRRAERWLLTRADVVASSAGLSQRVLRIAPRARVEEWRYASTESSAAPEEIEDVRRSLALPDEARVVLYSGTFEPYQGLDLLLQAVPLVRRSVPEAVFVLVGGTPGELPSRARSGDEGVRILPRQPKGRIPAYAALADVLVSPRTFGANVPLKVFDYLAASRPIVATDIPAHRVVLDEDLALLVPAEARALAGGIVRVLREPEIAERLARNARRYAERQLGWISFVKSVGELYAEARSGRRPSPPA